MASRSSRARTPDQTGISGGSRLTLAKLIVHLENLLQVFAPPLMLGGLFLVLAWLNIFAGLYPWAHLVALAIFVAVFFHALGKARLGYHRASLSAAHRRVEEASGLSHRPFDTVTDQPAAASDEQHALWQEHIARSKTQLKNLRWPHWKLNFADHDPYALRYALLIMLMVAGFSSWGIWGGRLLTAINPALASSMHMFKPALDAWITPPEYTSLPPIMIATPAGTQHKGELLTIPAGSTITAHLAEKSGDAPTLSVNGQKIEFTADDHQDFGVSATINNGDVISIHRGWKKLGEWKVHVVADQTPQIDLTEPPSVSERKSLKLSWKASDDYSVAAVDAKITPRESLPGTANDPIEIQLATPGDKEASRTNYEDLTASPWAGLSVQIQLSATDAAGRVGQSEPIDFVLPERIFFNPVARALIDERKKLLMNPDNENVRTEAANVMAGIAAHNLVDYHGDPVVLMALRAGAVRLVLNRSTEVMPPVIDTLWQTAVRIEDGAVSMAEENLRQAQRELADAIDHNADQAEIQKRIDRLHEALAQYLAQLSARTAAQPPMNDDLEQALGEKTNALTPQDLDRMLEQMRDLSASGARDAARNELAKLQQLLENLHTGGPQLTAAQKEEMKRITALRQLSQKQKQLLDQTFRQAQQGNEDNGKLAMQQEDLRKALRTLMDSGTSDNSTDDLDRSEQSMKSASSELGRAAPRTAVNHQNQALAALQKALDSMTDNLKSSMFMLPKPGNMFGQGRDPFGRSGFGGFARDDGGVQVPDRMEARRVREILNELQRRSGETDRSKTERDYIDRLLQNF